MPWYRKFKVGLEQIEFIFNAFHPCMANRKINGSQHTICYHVDGTISFHLQSKVNDNFAKWANDVSGQLKPV